MDKNSVITVPISRNDRFNFTRSYDSVVIGPLLAEVNTLNRTIRDIPILPASASQLDEEIIRRSIFGTAAIEGNPLTEKEVTDILSHKESAPSAKKAETEIRNLQAAYRMIQDTNPSNESGGFLSEDWICSIHSLVMEGLDDCIPGKYRHEPRKVGDVDHGGTYHPPKTHKDVTILMRVFSDWINGENMMGEDPVISAAAAHFHLGMIHPFANGNGRIARLVEAAILRTAGFRFVPEMLSNYYYRHIHGYYQAFSLARKHSGKEITPFLEFILRGLVESFEEIKNRMFAFITYVSLKELFNVGREGKDISHRQHDLLLLLLEERFSTSFTLYDITRTLPFSVLYRGRSERTAARDIKKLIDLALLKWTEPGKFSLNTRLLQR